MRGVHYERIRALIANDVALYASHLPLDAHASFGNNVLLARALGLEPSGAFAQYQGVSVGVCGECDLETAVLVERAHVFARAHGGAALVSPIVTGRRTRYWGMCTGGGASAETMREALTARIDTMIVGEGPHHTAVDAADTGLAIIYAGHYATETLGIRALAEHTAAIFGLPWTFVEAPTGL
ncbi:MAG: hypothetical protein NVS4B3_01550 [Gemmatimonadaceae bacterium]